MQLRRAHRNIPGCIGGLPPVPADDNPATIARSAEALRTRRRDKDPPSTKLQRAATVRGGRPHRLLGEIDGQAQASNAHSHSAAKRLRHDSRMVRPLPTQLLPTDTAVDTGRALQSRDSHSRTVVRRKSPAEPPSYRPEIQKTDAAC